MGLLDNTSQVAYYKGSDYGSYQFTSLEDIINQFLVAYVGEGKIISKASRTDVAFHAQRAMQELSFDTFKSIKSQEITLPPSNTMILPHDYVNYTKVLWSDASGIKHPIYPTKHTQNPFSIKQDEDGSYSFGSSLSMITNGDFTNPLQDGWTLGTIGRGSAWSAISGPNQSGKYNFTTILDTIKLIDGELEFGHVWFSFQNQVASRAHGVWQHIDVTNAQLIDLKATGTSGDRQLDGSTILCDYGVLRIGISSVDPSIGWVSPTLSNLMVTGDFNNPFNTNKPSPNYDSSKLDLGYLEWTDGTSSEKELLDIDVSSLTDVWVYIQSYSPWTSDAVTEVDNTTTMFNGGTTAITPTSSVNNTHQKNTIDNVFVGIDGDFELSNANTDGNSTTWSNYKSATPSENQDDYQDDTYWPNNQKRYGLDPQHAQVNGSFYIDNLRGLINFSSNISGKTVILDYISDSLGTDGEMQVHKFAEEAMYRWILHAIAAGRIQTQQLVPRLKKEKIAAIRQAKLRLSNVKLEELTQILRGKSKHIKH